MKTNPPPTPPLVPDKDALLERLMNVQAMSALQWLLLSVVPIMYWDGWVKVLAALPILLFFGTTQLYKDLGAMRNAGRSEHPEAGKKTLPLPPEDHTPTGTFYHN